MLTLCSFQAWKARVTGYEEVTKLFVTAGDEKAPIFGNYQGLIRKFVTDSNAISQEKGMDAVIAYIENASANMIGRCVRLVDCVMLCSCSCTCSLDTTPYLYVLHMSPTAYYLIRIELKY